MDGDSAAAYAGEVLNPRVVLRPPALRRGSTVGVIAPAGVIDEAALLRGVSVLEEAGFRVRLGEALLARRHYLAGSDAQRAEDLHRLLLDPAVRALFCARGGYGSGRLLPLVDADLLRRDPKPVVGHSDLTFLLNDLRQRAGVVTFHGPMVSWFAEQRHGVARLLALLSGEPPAPVAAEEIWREGEAEGEIAGGCLSIVVAMLGTPHALDTRGKLLFLEDVNERPYRVDRMLTQLRQAGVLDDIAALVIGEMPGTFEDEDVGLADIVLDVCGAGGYPIVAGVPSGHGRGTLTLPLGVRARLRGAELTFLEPAVA